MGKEFPWGLLIAAAALYWSCFGALLAALALLKIRSVVWWQAALMVAGGFLLLLIPVIGMPLVVPVTAGLLSWRGGISLERALAAVLVQFGILWFCLLAVVMPWYWRFD